MPEIAEVARIVHFLRKCLVGKTLKVVETIDDANVYGKVGTTAAAFQTAMLGKKVIGAGQQGKYFWLVMDSAPHPVMHLGMTGWVRIKGEPTQHYRPKPTDEKEEWPPKYWKFILETEDKTQAAFTDPRRFARIRLVDCKADDIRQTTPLKENGPDPFVDRKLVTVEWLTALMRRKHVPVKALLLDQANISGIGNWVGDEILYHAKLHPEQYSDTFSEAQLKQLHASIIYITKTAVDVLADSTKFPEEWMFNYRWGKGKKDAVTKLPSGAAITYLTVGGRTSCIVPSVQKKTAAVAGDVKTKHKEITNGHGTSEKPPKSSKRKASPPPLAIHAEEVITKSEVFTSDLPEGEAAGSVDQDTGSKRRKLRSGPAKTNVKAEISDGVVKKKIKKEVEAAAAPNSRRRSGRIVKS